MKTNLLLLLSALLISDLCCRAQTADELGVPRRSSFNDFTLTHDPFLPIGSTGAATPKQAPVNGSATPAPIESYIRPEAFVVSSILFDRIPLAVINGKGYGEGDTLPFNAGGTMIKLLVYAIRDGAVTLHYNDFKVVCPIRVAQKPPSAKK